MIKNRYEFISKQSIWYFDMWTYYKMCKKTLKCDDFKVNLPCNEYKTIGFRLLNLEKIIYLIILLYL
jgi:hypothetical protein